MAGTRRTGHGITRLREWSAWLRRRVRRWEDRRQAAMVMARLAQEPGYAFSADYISARTAAWSQLFQALQGAPGVRFLEVGSYEGRSAVWFLENLLTHPTALLTCVDLFAGPGVELRFDHNIRCSGGAARVVKLKGLSSEILPALPPESYDAVYVDGSHLAADVLLDAMLAWRLLKPGGVLLFDDYLWEPSRPAFQRPQLAIDLFLEVARGQFDLLQQEYQVAVRKR